MYDVIIIGAGPAGLFTAYELSEKNKNLKILLLEKGKLAQKILFAFGQDAETKKNLRFLQCLQHVYNLITHGTFLRFIIALRLRKTTKQKSTLSGNERTWK